MEAHAVLLDEEEETAWDRNRAPAMDNGVAILNPEDKMPSDIDEDIREASQQTGRRVQYTQMHAHMELAAIALATGCTIKQAAGYAGVSRAHLKTKYMPDPDFRARVAELHTQMTSTIKGRIVAELLRRTQPEAIKGMEILDVLRIGDRVGLSRGAGAESEESDQDHRKYNVIFNQVLLHAGPEGGDFPIYRPERPALPGEDSPVEG
jgi:hypothetical protein